MRFSRRNRGGMDSPYVPMDTSLYVPMDTSLVHISATKLMDLELTVNGGVFSLMVP